MTLDDKVRYPAFLYVRFAMGKKQDRLQIVTDIKEAAILYKKKLVGKTFLYVFDNRAIEVIYKASSFMHLTGVESSLSAKEFYKEAVKGKLTANQINFSARHPFPLCKKKIIHISSIASFATSECFMLEDISTSTACYKFGTTDMNFTLCLNREYDTNGCPKGTNYIVQSLRDEDCFDRSNNVFEVAYIFSKQNDVSQYTDLEYADSRYSLYNLPESITALLSSELLTHNL